MHAHKTIDAKLNNLKDTIDHFADHLSKSNRRGNEQHNRKWLVLSIYHAIEQYFYLVLVEIDDKNKVLVNKNNQPVFPALNQLSQCLKENLDKLNIIEKKLIEWSCKYVEIRHAIQHRIPEEVRDETISFVSLSLLGIIKSMDLRFGVNLIGESDFYEKDFRDDLLESINWKCHDEYNDLIEKYLSEKYPLEELECCPLCNLLTVHNSDYCEACLQELEEVECTECVERYLIPVDENIRNSVSLDCPVCEVRKNKSRKI